MLTDPRLEKLAEVLTGFSTQLKKGERVLIEAFDAPDAMVVALVQAARRRGAVPFALTYHARVTRELMRAAVEAQLAPHAAVALARTHYLTA